MLDLDFIEACYSEAPSDDVWGARLADRMARVVPEALGVMAAPYSIDASGLRYQGIAGDARFAEAPTLFEVPGRIAESWNALPQRQQMFDRSFAAATPRMVVISDWPRELATPILAAMPWRESDCMGLFGTLDCEHGYVLSPGTSGRFRVSRRRRQQLMRLSEHIATGYWLRRLRAPGSLGSGAEAIFTPNGKILHQDVRGAPELTEHLVDAVRRMERARCRRQKRSPDEATELWQALLAGQYTLVESFERSGRRLILAVRCRTPRPALTERQGAVAALAAGGAANKTIAAKLGIATGTVGVHLSLALRKLRCPNRRALAQWLQAAGGTAA
jgi:DNA-binding CsgD family transcriptional regulator